MEFNAKSLDACISRLEGGLIAEMDSASCWRGRLSSSALSTAVAIFALSLVDSGKYSTLIRKGAEWLVANVNRDGGWGDTPDSPSNMSTSILVWCALSPLEKNEHYRLAARNAEKYISGMTGSVSPEDISRSILGHYGNDRTFSVPILTMCALAGRLGDDGSEWNHVLQLPFELSVLPRSFFRIVGLPVVSYALPALVSMGILRHRKTRGGNPVMRLIRNLASEKALDVLRSTLPSSGGFLEAVPLTGFVTMSLVAAGCKDENLIGPCSNFLESSFREDGSCPIDSDLATWLTSLSVKALGKESLGPQRADGIRRWLLSQQFKSIHPFTGAAPGGWAWTDLPGGVPDADDSSSALIALKLLDSSCDLEAISSGIEWLVALQNRDGGIPTFCKGWGRLPFDRSCPEITAHTIEAFSKWRHDVGADMGKKMDAAAARAIEYLRNSQRSDGAWIPLWFGNQSSGKKQNPVYGTSRVLVGLNSLKKLNPSTARMLSRAAEWLLKAQNPDGGWGGDIGLPTSIEETALAVHALSSSQISNPELQSSLQKGVSKLLELIGPHKIPLPSPIGLYFSSLWYSERLYPLIFTLSALKSCKRNQAFYHSADFTRSSLEN